METKEVIEAIKNDDSRKLIKALYSIALPPIERHIKQKRGTRADAEDCFQEAVLTLVKKVKDGSFNDQFEVKNFLFILARNSWYNKLKRSGRVVATELEDDQIEDESDDVEAIMIDKERQEAVSLLMSKAGERCKELFRLLLFENKKMKEVVSIMGFGSVEVVKTNNYRCKKKLKEALKNDSHLMAALQG